MKNTTEQDAFTRLIQARIGSMVDAQPEYLASLRSLLFAWIDEIDAHTKVQIKKHMSREPENEDGEEWFDTVPIPERMKPHDPARNQAVR